MSGFNSLRRGNRGGPQIEGMRGSKELKSSVSPYYVSSYDEKRPDYVAWPDRNPNEWEQLASALKQFNPALDRMVADSERERAKEMDAKGRRLQEEKKMAWAEFVKQHPEYTGANPYLIRGYKAAELQTKGQLYLAAQKEYYINNNFANETDPAKVQEGMNASGEEWAQKNVFGSGDYDDRLIAENFLETAKRVDAALMQQHSEDRKGEHLRLAGEKYSEHISTTINTALAGTPDITNPDVWLEKRGELVSYIQGQMIEMEASGLSRSKVHEIVTNSLINLAIAEGHDGYADEILGLINEIPTGTGTLGGTAETKARVAETRRSLERQRKTQRDEAFQAYERQRTRETHEAYDRMSQALFAAHASGIPTSKAELVKLAGPNDFLAATNLWSSIRAHENNPVTWSTEKYLNLAVYEDMAWSGLLDIPTAMSAYSQFGPQGVERLTGIVRKVQDGNDIQGQILSGKDFAYAADHLKAQVAVFFPKNSGQLMDDGSMASLTQQMQVEAVGQLRNATSVYLKEYGQKNSGKSPLPEELRVFWEEKAQAIGRSYQIRAKEVEGGSSPILLRPPSERRDWSTNTTPFLGESAEAVGSLVTEIKRGNTMSVIAGIMSQFGLSQEEAEAMLANQFSLYNIEF